jgi:hypothetical protein
VEKRPRKPVIRASFLRSFTGYVPSGSDEASNMNQSTLLQRMIDHGDPQATLFARSLRSLMSDRDREAAAEEEAVSIGGTYKGKATKGWLTREPLIAIASLVTGRWGPFSHLHLHEEPTMIDGREVIDAVKSDKISPHDFAARMVHLEQALEMVIGERGISDEATATIAKMGSAVQFILGRIADYQATGDAAALTIWSEAGLPLGTKWTVLANGNGKLPFKAYSELPMATCPGAGGCAVYIDTPAAQGQKGYCYSFRAWRYANAFARQFLNTLANTADNVFRAVRGEGGTGVRQLTTRIRRNPKRATKFVPGPGLTWKQFVGEIAAASTAKARAKQTTFLRLFVDGDMSSASDLKEWMEVVRSLGVNGRLTRKYLPEGHGKKPMRPMEVYGYSKAWDLFTKADKDMGSAWWPKNYTVNLSMDSRFNTHTPKTKQKHEEIRKHMESLPISRGYFKSVNFKSEIADFVASLRGKTISPITPDGKVNKIVQQFSSMMDLSNTTLTWQQVWAIAEAVGITVNKGAKGKEAEKAAQVAGLEDRSAIFENWFKALLEDKGILKRVHAELVIDFGVAGVKKLRSRTKKEIEDGKPAGMSAYWNKAKKKIIALALDDVLWAYGQGGSCPLICSNCYDIRIPESTPRREARKIAQAHVHRCASKPGSLFGRTESGQLGAAIHIGLH